MKQESVLNFAALIRIVVVGLAVYLAWKGLTILVMLLIAALISMALVPIAEKLNKKMPWWLSVIMVILLLLIPIVAVITMTAAVFLMQFPELVANIRAIIETVPYLSGVIRDINIMETLQGNAGYVLNSTKTAVTIVGSIATVIAAAFYMTYDHKALKDLLLGTFSADNRSTVSDMFKEISSVVGHYIRGNLLISGICMVVTFVALTIIGVPFAIPLAVFTGIMGLLPYIGPLMGLIPAVLLAYTHSPLAALITLIWYIVYQQVENGIISPFLYNKALNLSPALVFLSVILGAGLFGITGAFLALPVAASVPVLIKYGQKMRKSYAKTE